MMEVETHEGSATGHAHAIETWPRSGTSRQPRPGETAMDLKHERSIGFDVNELFKVITSFLSGRRNYGSLRTNSGSSFLPNGTPYSFHHEFSGMCLRGHLETLRSLADTGHFESVDEEAAAEEYRMRGMPEMPYKAGRVIDALFEHDSAAFFVSIFFCTDDQTIYYRLFRLGWDPEKYEDCLATGPHPTEGDVRVDDGSIPFGDSYVEIGKRIGQWMLHAAAEASKDTPNSTTSDRDATPS